MDVKSTDEETQKEEAQQHFHVLAVDDSVIDRKVLERLLRVSSYQVTCVESGDKALEYLGLVDGLDGSSFHPASSSLSTQRLQKLKKQTGRGEEKVHVLEGAKVNLIMTDYCMPGMSGYDLLKRLKGSSCKDVPVIVMSSENIPARINMCLEEGAEEFLLKPLQLSDVKKLQPHLLKSMVSQPCTCKEIPKNGGKMTLIRTTATSSTSNSNNKRKASSPEPAERRPKMKETYSLDEAVHQLPMS